MARYHDVLRYVAVNDRRLVSSHPSLDPTGADAALGPKSRALVRVAALLATDGSFETYRWVIGDALDAGANPDEIVDVMLAVAPLVGMARVVASAPKVAHALDYDLDAALESLET